MSETPLNPCPSIDDLCELCREYKHGKNVRMLLHSKINNARQYAHLQWSVDENEAKLLVHDERMEVVENAIHAWNTRVLPENRGKPLADWGILELNTTTYPFVMHLLKDVINHYVAPPRRPRVRDLEKVSITNLKTWRNVGPAKIKTIQKLCLDAGIKMLP